MSICSTTESGELYRAEITYYGDELNRKETKMFHAKFWLLMEEGLTVDETRQELERYVDKVIGKDVRMRLNLKVNREFKCESESWNFWISPGVVVFEFVFGSVIFLAFCSFLGHWRRNKG